MGPLTLDQLREKLSAQHADRKLTELGQLWETFGLRGAFVESMGTNAFAATVVGDGGVGTLREVGGMLSLQLTPLREVTGVGVRERAENVQLFLIHNEKEFHLAWPGSLSAALADPTFQWIVQQWRASHSSSAHSHS